MASRTRQSKVTPFGGPDSEQDVCTPIKLFRELERRYAYGGRFDLDVCCTRQNCLVPGGPSDTKHWDALMCDWLAPSCFINPPWRDCAIWMDHTIRQILKGSTEAVCWLGPVRMSQPWWHKAKAHGRLVEILNRVEYYRDGERIKGMPLDSAVWLFERPIEAKYFR